MDKIVGIGEGIISNDEKDTIKTFALGSCVAITVYCSLNKIAGMAHVVLPSFDKPSRDSSNMNPYYYAATAVPFLINEICTNYGCFRNKLRIKLFGGANSIRINDTFKIGQKNIAVVKKILTDLNLLYCDKETGGTFSRTVYIDVSTGNTSVIVYPY
jgi:chemotaxis protein CheD